MRKLWQILSLAIVAICGGLLVLFNVAGTGWKAYTVATGSMKPAIPPGSLVAVHRVSYTDLKVGDVITYINPKNTSQTITHRITELKRINGIAGLVTKGDANPTADPEIVGGNVVGKVVFHAPVLGNTINWVRTPLGLVIVVLIPAIFIIWSEIMILRRNLKEDDKPAAKAKAELSDEFEPTPVPERKPMAESMPLTVAIDSPPSPAVQRSPKRRMDGLRSLILIPLVIAIGVKSTQAAITSNSVALTGNTIQTRILVPTHILINRVLIGGPGSASCIPPLTTTNIGNTGSGSVNIVNANFICSLATNNNTSTTVTNSNNQSSTSGNASSSGNTSGGSSTTGATGNNNSTSTTVVTNNNSSNSSSGASYVEFYNPTNAAVSITGWKLVDNSGVTQTLSGTIPAHGYFVAQILMFQLAGAGDHILLQNQSSIKIDAVSWGSDVTQLSPAVASFPAGMLLARKSVAVDTDTANDWDFVPY